jgi:hypothetical protein
MSLRISSALALSLALVACGDEAVAPPPVAEGDAIDCAIGPGAEYSPVCTLEWIAAEDGDEAKPFLIHHPAGGFRRVNLDPLTARLSARDGAGELVDLPSDVDGVFEFEIDTDRYRIPLTALAAELQ